MKFALNLSAMWSRIANWWIKKLDDKRWSERLSMAYAAVPGETAKQLLDNQVAYLRQNYRGYGQQEFIQRDNADKLNSLLFSIAISAIRNQLELTKAVGVQPLNGPVGLVYKLTYGERFADDSKLLQLAVTKHAVEARTQKLTARIEVDHLQKADTVCAGLAAEASNALGQEIAFECVSAVVNDLYRLAKVNATAVETPADASLEADTLAIHVSKAANQIGLTTRRGVGNFVIGSAETLEKLKASRAFVAKESEAGMLKLVGELNGLIKVYEFAAAPAGELLIGYNGQSATDTGYVYCPYVPLLMTGPVIDAQTYTPIFCSMTRFGKHVVTVPEETDNGFTSSVVSSDYYALLKVQP